MQNAEKFSGTDRCVKCGLCLPHCPTYVKTRDENESPRGRLALIQGWSKGELPLDARLQQHVDNCLLCRACEKACPAQVPYGDLVDDFRALQPTPVSDTEVSALARMKVRFLSSILESPYKKQLAGSWVAAVSRLVRLGGLGKTEAFHELAYSKGGASILKAEYRTRREVASGTVALFTGCASSLFDHATLMASIKVLNAIGFNVIIPKQQVCCGAISLHSGDSQRADRMRQTNLKAFDDLNADAVVSVASGCGATLKEYQAREASDRGGQFSSRVMDISAFIAAQEWPCDVSVSPLRERVFHHIPCTLKNVLRQDEGARQLLSRIPDLEVQEMRSSSHCCGAAGTYMLEHPDTAAALRQELIAQVRSDCTAIVTSNIGCALHIAAGDREIEVIHPVALLAKQLET